MNNISLNTIKRVIFVKKYNYWGADEIFEDEINKLLVKCRKKLNGIEKEQQHEANIVYIIDKIFQNSFLKENSLIIFYKKIAEYTIRNSPEKGIEIKDIQNYTEEVYDTLHEIIFDKLVEEYCND